MKQPAVCKIDVNVSTLFTSTAPLFSDVVERVDIMLVKVFVPVNVLFNGRIFVAGIAAMAESRVALFTTVEISAARAL